MINAPTKDKPFNKAFTVKFLGNVKGGRDILYLPDSYGYRPNKSALDAIGITRRRCWDYDWVIEFDIVGLFDNLDHELLMRAVKKHTDNKCVILYIERWLKAPMQMPDGTLEESKVYPLSRTKWVFNISIR